VLDLQARGGRKVPPEIREEVLERVATLFE
jgi:hypothetical protein